LMTEWRRMQSRANPSPLNSLLTGKNTGNFAPNVQKTTIKWPLCSDLAQRIDRLMFTRTGTDQGKNSV